jgi:hypothetical protein
LPRPPSFRDRWKTARALASGSGFNYSLTLDRHVCSLRVDRKGEQRAIELDGRDIAQMPRVTIREPWREFSFERAGHLFVVAFAFVWAGFGRADASTKVDLFADGISISDGRTLEEWRARVPKPGTMPGEGGVLRIGGIRFIAGLWLLGVVLFAVLTPDKGLTPRAAAFLLVPAAYFEALHLVQGWAHRRKDLGLGIRMSAILAVVIAPMVALGILAAIVG